MMAHAIKCNVCGAEISTDAYGCPKCGARTGRLFRVVARWAIIGLIAFVLLREVRNMQRDEDAFTASVKRSVDFQHDQGHRFGGD